MSTNLAGNLIASARRNPDKTALKMDGVELSYAALDEASARAASLLRARGVQPGDRVGLMLPNVPYFAIAYYGILRAGGVVVPMNVLFKGREVGFILGDSGARVLLAWHDFAEGAEAGAEEAGAECLVVRPGEFQQLLADVEPFDEVVERDGSDTAVILYTSGTTGTPKGAQLTHSNLGRNAEISIALFSFD